MLRDQAEQSTAESVCCHCQPLSLLHHNVVSEPTKTDSEALVPASESLSQRLRAILSELFPRTAPLSILLLHSAQREPAPLGGQEILWQQRRLSHAPTSFLEQLEVSVRRVIRTSDQLLVRDEAGMVLVLPDVEEQGASSILERVYRSITLLQAETVIPPLTRETRVLIGCGSYPEPGATLEQLLYQSGLMARRFVLRPAITTQLRGVKPMPTQQVAQNHHDPLQESKGQTGIPFMQLPKTVPARLKQLIPYHLAQELRCAPVGRAQQCLTVAMADPAQKQAVERLHALTGLTIFPVACSQAELDSLLAHKW